MKTGTLLKFLFLLLFLIVGCVFLKQVVFPTSVQTGSPPSEKLMDHQEPIVIATGDMSGVYFPLGQEMADLFQKHIGRPSGTRVTNASIQNTKLVNEKQAELAFSTEDVLALPETKELELLVLTELHSNFIQIVTNDRTVQTLKDLRGKRISVGAVGSGTKLMAERILDAAGLQSHEVDLSTFSFTKSADALRNRTIDVAFFSSGLPNPVIEDIALEMDISLVPIPKQIGQKLHEEFKSYSLDVIKGETYRGIHESIPTLSVKNVLLTHKDLPQQEAYQIVKTLFDYLPDWQNVYLDAQEMYTAKTKNQLPIDFHPGALQFFNETIQK